MPGVGSSICRWSRIVRCVIGCLRSGAISASGTSTEVRWMRPGCPVDEARVWDGELGSVDSDALVDE